MPFFKNPERPEQNKKITKIVPGHPTGVLSSNYVRGKNQSLFTFKVRSHPAGGYTIGRFKRSFWLYLVSTVVIIVGITIFYLNFAGEIEAGWWPNQVLGVTWGNRKQLTLTNNSGDNLASTTTVAVTVNTKDLVSANKLQSDCDDLRIVYQPSSTAYTELSRYISYPGGGSCSTSEAAKVYFSLQANLNNGNNDYNYYIYYSNRQATTPGNPDNAFDISSKDALLVCPFDGTTTCAASETPSTATGAIRYSGAKSAMSFDGASDYVSIGNTSASIKTVEFWVYPETTTEYFIDINGSAYIQASSGTISATGFTSPTIYVNGTATSTISADAWSHVAVVSDTAVSASAVNVGLIGSNYLEGKIDEVRISDVIRYASNFSAPTTPFTRDEHTKLLMHFDENGDDPRNTGKAIDDSGNGNHGTITGAKYVAGLVGVDNGTTDTGKADGGNTYAGHEGIFIEEATTNKITNPSFDHATYNTNWTVNQAYTLQDEFTTDRAAGAVNGTSAEPTGGTRTVTDTNSKLSISGSQLSFATGGAGVGDPGLWYSSTSRTAGKIIINKINVSNLDGTPLKLGWDTNQTGDVGSNGFYISSVGAYAWDGTSTSLLSTFSTSTDYQLATILKTTGAYYFIKGGVYSNWTFLYSSLVNNTSTLYSSIAINGTVLTSDYIRVPTTTWLPTPLAYDTFTRADGAIGNTESTGPDSQTTPQLAWTGSTWTVSSNKAINTPGLGSEVVGDVGFDNDAYWTKTSGVTVSGSKANWTDAPSSASISRASLLTAGNWYQATLDVESISIGQFKIPALDNGVSGNSWSDIGSKVRTGKASSTTLLLRSSNSGPFNGVVDNLSVKPLTLSELFSSVSTSDTDVVASVDITLPGGDTWVPAGLVTNLDSTTSPANFLLAYHDGTNVHLDKNVGGTYTSLISTAATYSAGATLRVITYHSDANTLKVRVYYNNALIGSEQTVTDAGIISNTKHGLFSTYSGNTFDNFTLFPRGSDGEYASIPAEPTDFLTASVNTTAPYYKFGSKSVQLVNTSNANTYVTAVDPNSTATHTLSAYVYNGTSGAVGGTVDATVAKLVFGGTTVTPSAYTDMGGGWWRLTYSAATTDSSLYYGVEVQANKTVYIDGVQLEALAYATTYADGTLGTGYSWSGTAHESTSSRTITNTQYATSGNINAAAGSLSFWAKPQTAIGSISGDQYLLSIRQDASNEISIYMDDSDDDMAIITNGTATSSTGVTMAAGAWQHFVLTYDFTADQYKLYKNGNATPIISTTTALTAPTLPTNFNLGSDSSNANKFNGSVSDFRSFDSVLTTTEVADLYYAGLVSHSDSIQVDRFGDNKGQNPVGIYHFDESYGSTANDSSTYGNHLTVTGATWDTQSGNFPARLTRTLKFDGTDDMASRSAGLARNFNFGTDSFSLAGWFRHPSTVSGTDTIVAKYNTAGYKVYMNSSGYICAGIDDDSTFDDDVPCGTTSYADSKWHQFETVKDGSTSLTTYIDGNQVASDATIAATGTLNNNANFAVGVDSDKTNYWPGFLDEIVVYPYARSTSQVKADIQGAQTSALIGSGISDNLSSGLVGYWRMDDAGVDAEGETSTDSSGNSNSGTLYGDNGVGDNGTGLDCTASGKFGTSCDFDSTDDYIALSNLSVNTSAGAKNTVSFWMYWDGATNEMPFGWTGYDLYLYDGCFGFNTAQTNIIGISSANLTSKWVNVVAVFYNGVPNLTDNELYINGTKQNLTACLGSTSNSRSVSATAKISGWNSDTDYKFGGNIDDVRVYNRALSPAEVSQLYNWAPGPVVHLKMDEGSGTSAQDSSGNSRTGTLQGNPLWNPGKFGKGVKLDGSGDYVQVSDF